MVKRFNTKKLFSEDDITYFVTNFGLKRMPSEVLGDSLQEVFNDYILLALSEQGEQREDKARVYIEAQYHIAKAAKLLESMPHPAGKMSSRLNNMDDTLAKLIEGDHFASSRAARFMEKNLVRKIRDVWLINTSTPFHAGVDGSGRNPRDFLLYCFRKAYVQYPEIEWFADVTPSLADSLIKSVRKG